MKSSWKQKCSGGSRYYSEKESSQLLYPAFNADFLTHSRVNNVTCCLGEEGNGKRNNFVIYGNLEKPEALPALLLFLTALKTDMAH